MKRHHYFFLILILLAIYTAAAGRVIFSDDTFAYLMKSEGLYSGSFRSVAWLTGRPPLFPMLLGPAVLFCGRTLLAAHIFPFLFLLTIPFILFYTGRRIFKNDVFAFLGSLLFLIFPTNMGHLTTPLTEPISVSLILLSLLLMEKCRERLFFLPFYGLTLACLFLTRYETILLIIPECVYLLLALKKDGRLTRRKLLLVIAVLILFQLPFALFNLAGGSAFFPERSFHAVKMAVYTLVHPEQRMYGEFPVSRLVGISYRTYLGGNPLLPILILAGILLSWYRRSAILILGSIWCAGLYLFVLYYGTNIFLRHLTKITPFVCLFIMLSIFEIWKLCNRLSSKTLSISLHLVILGPIIGALLYSSAMDYRTSRDDRRYTLDRASLLEIASRNPRLPAKAEWYDLRSRNLSPREELIRQVLGHARIPGYLKQRADALGHKNFYTDFSDEAFLTYLKEPGTVNRIWKGPGGGPLGILPRYGTGEAHFQFYFERPIERIEYVDRHVSWTKKDRVSFLFSWNGQDWKTLYQDSRCYRPISFGLAMTPETGHERAFHLKYTFRAGDPRRQPDDNGGAALKEMAVSVAFRRQDLKR